MALAQSYRLQNNDTLTNCCDWNPVGHHRQAIANKQTWGETHESFEKVLQPPTEAALWENHLLEQLILPEWVNRHQISPVAHHRQQVTLVCSASRTSELMCKVWKCVTQCAFSPKLKSHPDESLPLLHQHRVGSGRGRQRLGSAPYHNHDRVALATLGEEVRETRPTNRVTTWSGRLQ